VTYKPQKIIAFSFVVNWETIIIRSETVEQAKKILIQKKGLSEETVKKLAFGTYTNEKLLP